MDAMRDGYSERLMVSKMVARMDRNSGLMMAILTVDHSVLMKDYCWVWRMTERSDMMTVGTKDCWMVEMTVSLRAEYWGSMTV